MRCEPDMAGILANLEGVPLGEPITQEELIYSQLEANRAMIDMSDSVAELVEILKIFLVKNSFLTVEDLPTDKE